MHFYNNTKQLVRSILLGIFFLSFTTLGINAQVQIMVDDDSSTDFADATSHSTWATATYDLQAAIDGAAAAGGGTIWVAGGTYYPTKLQAADPTATAEDISGYARYSTFVMANNVTVIGGFEGGETTLADRPVDLFGTTNTVVLSGDLNQTGIVDTFDSYHVVLFPEDTDDSAVLQNVKITGGYANLNNFFSDRGAGVHARLGGIISGCVITDNIALEGGGGAYLYKGATITECEISNNSAQILGAGVLLNGGGTITSSLIHSNHTLDDVEANGGGVFFDSPDATYGTVSHSIIIGNLSDNKGGGIGTYGEGIISNCLIANNESAGNGGGAYLQNGGMIINSSIVNNLSINDLADGVYGAVGGEVHNTVIWNNDNAQFDRIDETTLVDYSAIEGGFTGTGVTNLISLSSVNSDPGSGVEEYPEFRNPVSFTGIPENPTEFTQLLDSDYRFNLTSALLDAGNSSIPGLPALDLGGNPRITKGAIDIGAYEALYYTVTGTVSGSNGTIEPVGPVNYLDGEEVVFTLTPDATYDVATFTVNAADYYDQIVDQGAYYTYTVAAISSDLDAEVSFGIVNSISEAGEDVFNVYPIPADDQLFIEDIEVSLLEIYSASGKLEKQLNGNVESPINVSDLTKGLYILIIEDTKGEIKTVRFIKN